MSFKNEVIEKKAFRWLKIFTVFAFVGLAMIAWASLSVFFDVEAKTRLAMYVVGFSGMIFSVFGMMTAFFIGVGE